MSTSQSNTSQPREQQVQGTRSAPKRRPGPETQTTNTLSPIAQAEALRVNLREALAKSNELIRGLKHQDRQARLVASTLDSLKQLKVA